MLTDRYFCDGINAGDFNRDGRMDVVAGPFWYEGPQFQVRHEFYPARPFPPAESPTNSMFSYVYDFNGDGWPDILVLGRVHKHEAYWYENPRGGERPWKKHFVFHRIMGESPPFTDVDGDGRPELVTHWKGRWGLLQPSRDEAERPWRFRPITDAGDWPQFYHGTGIGDVDGDGRLDLILNDGWWEQPAAGAANRSWAGHRFRFGSRGGAQMFACDVDGDGDADVITALDAHGWGLAWFEQVASGDGVTFRRHLIMGDRAGENRYGAAFSQPHAMALADINGNGLPDIVVGKRRWAHGPEGDVEPNAPPVLYWFELMRRENNLPLFRPHLIDDSSGVGVQLTVTDVNGDDAPDVLTASKLGAFIFMQTGARAAPPADASDDRPAAHGKPRQSKGTPPPTPQPKFRFRLHEIDRPGGRAWGQTSLVDVDGDGDLDFISGKRGGDVFWFEYKAADRWVRHRIGQMAQTDVGGVAFDVNGDGLVDQVSGATLYLHPGKNKLRTKAWRRIGDVAMSSHDHRIADIDGDGRDDLLAMSDRRGVFWYRIPADPTKKWIEHAIGPARHSGLEPGDVDGDGDIDVVRADWWFENADGRGTRWLTHRNIPFPGRRYNQAGMATQNRLADIDRDGDLDLVMTDGETKDAKVCWLANLDGKGLSWKLRTLAKGLGALHSLAAADFDKDGDLDIFTCEFHIGGEKRWFIFENVDGRGGEFVRHVILEGVEGHESVVGDVDGDGDLDICSKPWNGDRHVYLENLHHSE